MALLPRRSDPLPLPVRGLPGPGLDALALRAQLTAAGADKAAVLDVLRTALKTGLDRAEEAFTRGRLGGLEMARQIAAVHDAVLGAVWDHAVHLSPGDGDGNGISLMAVGGYGRGEMAPFSDLDLLFLVEATPGPRAAALTEYVLYTLWDLGLKIGHATRTVDQCLKLAREDQTILTALLDLRYLEGDAVLATELQTRFRRDVVGKGSRGYIAAKLAERDDRHAREGDSRYQIEPDIKCGKGGLRDLHVLYWIADYLSDRDMDDPQAASPYVAMGLFDDRAAERFTRAADFLWRARIHLHLTANRATETLSFDHQTTLARVMGYASGPVEVAVERFMREYFTNAREVGALTRIACAKLEAENAIRLPAGLDKLLPRRARNIRNTAFRLRHGRLDFRNPLTIKDRPAVIMELFETAGRRNLDIHPDALQAIDFRRNLIDDDFRRDPEISAIFQSLLLNAVVPGATLKVMNEAGVLGRYLLEFGGIVARTQFNMHHAYTVDEHTLGLVRDYNDIEKDFLEDELPLATDLVARFTQDQRLTLYLACLLHDTGKGQGDQSIEGAKLARRACRRLGIGAGVTNDVAWLVRRHLLMSETAQRRDISDPETVAEFCRVVGTRERLDMLLAITVVDIRSVGPGIWNDWKATLLRGLHHAARAQLSGRLPGGGRDRKRRRRERLAERLEDATFAAARPVMDVLPDVYWRAHTLSAHIRHAKFFADIDADASVRVRTRLDRPNDVCELWVLARDRSGLFADLTLAISSQGALITGAQLYTGTDGITGQRTVFNIFYLQNSDGLAFGRRTPGRLEKLAAIVTRASQGDVAGLTIPPARPSRRAEAIPVRPRVAFSATPKGLTTVIEIEGRDRPGLLHALADALSAEDLSVLSAHIEVVGERAVDAFYVCPTASGEACLPPTAHPAIEAALLAVLKREVVPA